MKRLLVTFLFAGICSISFAQLSYEPSEAHPYGLPNPDAPQQIKDFQPMIGECKCSSTKRNPDGSWAETDTMIWRFKYIMNGWAVQDETFQENGTYSGSIRQFDPEVNMWNVHFYASVSPLKDLPSWQGSLKDGKIILYDEQKAPNGLEGFYKITFYDMTDEGYKWIGEWVNPDESIVYPTWTLDCKR